jgi:uncharacterized protein (DUF1501 family)
LASLSEQSVHGAPADNGHILVVVQIAGGNDGLNTVVPITDGRYYDARPGLAIAPEQALPLDGSTGFHPSLGPLKELWDQSALAIVEGVGYPSPNFSHFVSMDIWETADPYQKLLDGWLGRYFQRVQGQVEAPFLGLAVGRALPTAFETTAVTVPSLEQLATYQFQGDPRTPSLNSSRLQALMSLYQRGESQVPYGPTLYGAVQAASASIQVLQAAHQAYKPSVQYPNTPLAQALRLVAESIAAKKAVKIFHVSIGGFDTHANQTTDHPRQLSTLATALHTFYTDLKAQGLDSNVLIMTWSEFGRRVKSNASSGTDHGSAAPLFFLGTPVKGGFYGQRPDLGNLDNGNLRYTVDFRSVYATALESWLGAPSQELLGANFEPLPLLKA